MNVNEHERLSNFTLRLRDHTMLFLQVTVSVGSYYFFQTTNKQILDIDDIAVGDHIKFDRGLYSHHAVVSRA
jgi:hypothetical protein